MLTVKNRLRLMPLLSFSVIIISFLIPASAQEPAKVPQNINEQAEKQRKDQAAVKRKKITQEATAALNETKTALEALGENKINDALAALERATGKLEIILAREPLLKLAPVSLTVKIQDLNRNLDEIKSMRVKIESLLFNNQIQDARKLLNTLASEMVIKMVNIPLGTFPLAMTSVAALTEKGDIKAAKDVLERALNTLIITQTVIPLPISNAQALLFEAEKIVNNTNRSAEENKRLELILKSARSELKFAEALGYGTKKDFKKLYEELDAIEGKTKGGKSGEGVFNTIKTYLSDILKDSHLS